MLTRKWKQRKAQRRAQRAFWEVVGEVGDSDFDHWTHCPDSKTCTRCARVDRALRKPQLAVAK